MVESAVRMECAFCYFRCPTQQFYQHLLDHHSGQMNSSHMDSQLIPVANNNTTLINLNQTHLHVQPPPASQRELNLTPLMNLNKTQSTRSLRPSSHS